MSCRKLWDREVVYYETIERELNIELIKDRCDERLNTKAEETTRLAYTMLRGEI